MKKEGSLSRLDIVIIVMIVAIVALITSNIFSYVKLSSDHEQLAKEFEEEKNREKRVYFTEKEREELKAADTQVFCQEICRKRYYDGHEGGKLVYEGAYFDYECRCYNIVR
jgi:biopolymer transport protein ExbB/TolQ